MEMQDQSAVQAQPAAQAPPAAETPLDVILSACGDKAYLLDKLPFEKAEFQTHDDDVAPGSRKATPALPIKLKIGADGDVFFDGKHRTIWAYMFENTESDQTTRVGYFGENEEGESVQYPDRSLLQCAIFHDTFQVTSVGMIPALVKFYFYKKGVNLPYLPTFSKGNTEDLIRACGRFDVAVPTAKRQSRVFQNQNQLQTSSQMNNGKKSNQQPFNVKLSEQGLREAFGGRINFSPLSSPVASPVAEEYSTMSRTMSPGLFIPESYDSHETFFAKFSEASDHEQSCEDRIEGIVSAKKEQEDKIKEFRKQVLELKTKIEKASAELAKLHKQHQDEARSLDAAKVRKRVALERADPDIKRVLEFGIDMGRKESDRKRAKIAHGKDELSMPSRLSSLT